MAAETSPDLRTSQAQPLLVERAPAETVRNADGTELFNLPSYVHPACVQDPGKEKNLPPGFFWQMCKTHTAVTEEMQLMLGVIESDHLAAAYSNIFTNIAVVGSLVVGFGFSAMSTRLEQPADAVHDLWGDHVGTVINLYGLVMGLALILGKRQCVWRSSMQWCMTHHAIFFIGGQVSVVSCTAS